MANKYKDDRHVIMKYTCLLYYVNTATVISIRIYWIEY